ncbi:hypothetical protein KUD11_11715 [Roseovarius sp. LXJ103]|uniref:hypothetical protein n=1 Tax=Roseovarius carneus TaxID=2853164 RepID=UPI000D6197D7|nr:hypothetical protein [Roseovarius carneus]MBZ8119309.1 hypothetical protein [Roseovarius carneus]PWE35076.1 hypothetical protein DD563_03270 [Pelagicola sp. LXJ1103]
MSESSNPTADHASTAPARQTVPAVQEPDRIEAGNDTAKTERAATIEGALPDDPVILLGTFSAPSGTHALIRARGDIQRVTLGDTVGRKTVAAIAEGTLVLVRGTRSEMLHIPG